MLARVLRRVVRVNTPYNKRNRYAFNLAGQMLFLANGGKKKISVRRKKRFERMILRLDNKNRVDRFT